MHQGTGYLPRHSNGNLKSHVWPTIVPDVTVFRGAKPQSAGSYTDISVKPLTCIASYIFFLGCDIKPSGLVESCRRFWVICCPHGWLEEDATRCSETCAIPSQQPDKTVLFLVSNLTKLITTKLSAAHTSRIFAMRYILIILYWRIICNYFIYQAIWNLMQRDVKIISCTRYYI